MKEKRNEAITEGSIKMVGTNQDKIYNEVINYLDKDVKKSCQITFGDGNACDRIVDYIKSQTL